MPYDLWSGLFQQQWSVNVVAGAKDAVKILYSWQLKSLLRLESQSRMQQSL